MFTRCLLLPALLTAALHASANSGQVLRVGIDPLLPPPAPQYEEDRSELEKKMFGKVRYERVEPIKKEKAWNAVIGIVAAKSGVELELEHSTSQLDFELKLAKGYYDLAYMSPLQFVSVNSRTGYKAIAKRKAQPLRGLVVVSKNSTIGNMRDVENKVIVFPGLLDFASSIAPRVSLKNLNIGYTPHFVESPQQAYESVLSGKFIAAAGSPETFQALSPPVRDKLRIIWDTPGFTPHAFAVHSRVPFYSITRLQKALVGLNKTDTGKKILPLIHAKNGFEVARDRDWHDVKPIDLAELNNLANESANSGQASTEDPQTDSGATR